MLPLGTPRDSSLEDLRDRLLSLCDKAGIRKADTAVYLDLLRSKPCDCSHCVKLVGLVDQTTSCSSWGGAHWLTSLPMSLRQGYPNRLALMVEWSGLQRVISFATDCQHF